MTSARLGFLAMSACSFLLLGCPAPVDMHDPDASSGAGTGGSSSPGTGGSSSGSGGSSSPGTGGSSSGSGGSSSGSGGSSGGTGGSSGGTGGGSGSGGSSGGTGGMAGGDAGGGGMEAGAANGTKVPADIAAILLASCGTGTCHMGPPSYRTAEQAYTRLKGMAGAPCSQPRMIAGQGMNSLVVKAMQGMKPCGAAMRMPPGGNAVSMADITKIADWINAGAKPVP